MTYANYVQPLLWDFPHDEPHFTKPNEWGCTCKCLCTNCVNDWYVCVCDECPADSRIYGNDDI